MQRIEMGSNKFTPAPFERAKRLVYSEEETLTAMCIWEEALANERLMTWLREDEGACLARANALQLVEPMDRMFEIASTAYGYGDAFDWEFVPDCLTAILEQAPRFADLNQINEAAIIQAVLRKE